MVPPSSLGFVCLLAWALFGLIQGEIRCSCNTGACIVTSYLCKTQGSCYTHRQEGGAVYRSCIQNLTSEFCHKPGVVCCTYDLCNHESLDVEDSPTAMAQEHSEQNFHFWFNTAVLSIIFVGVFILIVLGFLAFQFLTDERRAYGSCATIPRTHVITSKQSMVGADSVYKNLTVVPSDAYKSSHVFIRPSLLESFPQAWHKWKHPVMV